MASENISKTLQIFYLTFNNLTVLPDMSMVKKLGKLDCAYNKIKTIEKAFGRDVNLVQLSMDHNLIEEFHVMKTVASVDMPMWSHSLLLIIN